MIYTAGYQTWRLEDLDTVAAQLGAVIVDIRFSPKSSREEWRKESLEGYFGARYHHIKTLGNKNYQGGKIELANPLAAVSPIHKLLQQGPIILLCMCRDWHVCHRRDAAEFLAKALDEEIEHLEPPSRKRATTPAPPPNEAPRPAQQAQGSTLYAQAAALADVLILRCAGTATPPRLIGLRNRAINRCARRWVAQGGAVAAETELLRGTR